MRIYLGGPMFTRAEAEYNLRLASRLRNKGYSVYCPNESEPINDKTHTHVTARMIYEFDVAALALYPGLVRTEEVLKNAAFFDMSNAESPEFQGRAVAHLAADPKLLEKSGRVFTSAGLALEYGYTDIDGYQPRPNTIETV